MLKEKVALHAADLGRSLHEGAPRHSPARFQGLMFAVARYGLLLDDIAERLRVTPGVIGRSA
jgi:hypothetical protein